MLHRPRPTRSKDDATAGRRQRLWRALVIVHGALLALLVVHALLILASGGARPHPLRLTLGAPVVASPVIALMIGLLAAFPIRRGRLSLAVFSGHEALALGAVSLIAYLANGTVGSTGDTLPARYLPLSLLREGNFDLDEVPFLYEGGTPYFLERVGSGHYVSSYPIGAALLALPIYAPSALGGVAITSPFVAELEKLAAAVIVALSVTTTYLAARRLASRGMALAVALVYALGTSSLSISSQALWQHGASQLAIATALYCLVRGRQEPVWLYTAGLPLAFSLICRPMDAVVVIPLGVYVFIYHARAAAGFIASGALPIAFQLWYNHRHFGDPFHAQFPLIGGAVWNGSPWTGLTGLLFSPGRGLFVYSPVLALSLLGMIVVWRRGGDPLLRAVTVGVIPSVALYSRWHMWWGGHSYGPRLLADLTPCFALLLCPLRSWFDRRWTRRVFGALAVWAILAHGVGAYLDGGRWNGFPDIDRFPERLWSWTDNPLSNAVIDVSVRTIGAMGLRPTSRSDPWLVVAQTEIAERPAAQAIPGEWIPLSLRARNAGEAAWITGASPGQIMFGWRWVKPSDPAPSLSVHALNHDVLPHTAYSMRFEVQAPMQAGAYLLEAGLVSMAGGHVQWVPDASRDALQFPIIVGASQLPTAAQAPSVASGQLSRLRAADPPPRVPP